MAPSLSEGLDDEGCHVYIKNQGLAAYGVRQLVWRRLILCGQIQYLDLCRCILQYRIHHEGLLGLLHSFLGSAQCTIMCTV